MNWYRKSLSAKLIVSFLIVAVIAGIVGTLGYVSIGTVNSGFSSAYVNYGIALGDLGEIGILYQKYRVTLRDILIDGISHKEEYQSTLKQCDVDIQAAFTECESKILDSEKSSFETLKQSYTNFAVLAGKVANLAFSGNSAEALILMRGEALKEAQNLQTAMDSLFESKRADGTAKSAALAKQVGITKSAMLIIIAFGVLLAVFLGLFVSKSMTKSIHLLIDAAEKISSGNLDTEITIKLQDEIGTLARTFEKMRDTLNETMDSINGASDQVAAGSRQLSESSISLSKGATEQASSVEELTASLEEISSQTQINATNAIEANDIAKRTQGSAQTGNAHMQDMLRAINEINNASASISKIIKVIDDIAFQTNILALNATVEAARAGQHGKGFAVVAEEVRNLAIRSANAAKETTAMIETSIEKAQEGSRTAKQTAEALSEIVSGIGEVAKLVDGIATASNEQASGLSQVNQGIMQVSQVIQTNSANAEESAAASEQLASQADLLKDQVKKFKLKRKKHSMSSSEEVDPDLLWMMEHMNELKKYIPKESGAEPTKPAALDLELAGGYGKY